MRALVKAILHHPAKLWLALLALCAVYGYARVLVLHYCIGAVKHTIYRHPSNFPHAFFLPFFYGSATLAFFLGIYHDLLHLHSGLWRYVLPLPLTARGRLYRIVGVPAYAFLLAVVEAVQVFRNPSMASDLARLASYLRLLREQHDGLLLLDDTKLQAALLDIKWSAWTLQTRDPTALAYVRLPVDILLALAVCVTYGIAMFTRVPRHDGEELREATRNNDLARVRAILARGVPADSRGSDGATALHICAQQAMGGIARELLERHADANVADRLGFTPLHWAVQLRREEVSPANRLALVRLLIEHGADPNKGDALGRTPISIAAKKENHAALEVIREMTASDGEAAADGEDPASREQTTL
ncbi:hypothetical protein P43SY_006423 [Pythium insidiosum]|uniref:Uncharacterized protein n=1 Tax=Pythium insidiosum TaxID=114742 RepID=A0AAD5LSX7_PYTIN|nr:hypothetical protein P43SY_006423 [Pythium insidiosum]